jgi:hypothetical protein
MRALSEITKHNMSRCKSILTANGYPVLDTQNLHIKLKPEKQLQTGTSPSCNPASSQTANFPPYRPTVMTLILVSNILYEYVYSEM